MIEQIKTHLTNQGKILLMTKKKQNLRKYLKQAGFKEIPYKRIALAFYASILFCVIAYFPFIQKTGWIKFNPILLLIIAPIFILFTEIIVLLIGFFLVKLFLQTVIFSRIKQIEQNLPLLLDEFSTNLKTGAEFWDALEQALSPELGVLNDDMSELIIGVRSGEMTESVLKEYSQRYDSYVIQETFEIILDSYIEGGGLTEILDRIADNLETIQFLKKNAVASVYNYIIFMSIISLMITPLLFALSYNVLQLIQNLVGRVVYSGTSNLPGFLSQLNINFGQFVVFSRITVGLIAGSAACIINIIRTGNLKGSPKLILAFIILSIAAYELNFRLITHLFSALFGVA